MSRRIRVNLTRWVCRMIGHRMCRYEWMKPAHCRHLPYCLRCGRVW